MKELFGIPLDTMLVVLALALGAGLVGVGALALRHPILLKLGVRNVGRRRARSALIVLGLMLGTMMMTAALATGDTMSHTIRTSAVKALGQTDEIVSPKGADTSATLELGAATGVELVDAAAAARIEDALAGSDLVDGVTPAIIEPVAVQNPAERTNEPRVTLFASDPARMSGFGTIQNVRDGAALSLDDLRPGEVFLNEKAADELLASAGDGVILFTAQTRVRVMVGAVVRYDGAGTDDSALLLPIAAAQKLLGQPGQVNHVLISNRGDATSGAGLSDQVVRELRPVLTELGLEAETSKQDAIEMADEQGAAFIGLFTTFGSFSIAAGILLIFLIFVMLAAERRGELGIARAIGTRRGHLVEMFTFEGAAYDLAAALVGALLGAVVAYGMVILLASALGSEGIDVQYSITARSLAVAYALGVLITLVVVAISAWRVSVMTISTAIRNLPEPRLPRRRRRLFIAFTGFALAALLTVSGASSSSATPILLGVSLAFVSLVPLLRVLGVPERIAFTSCGTALVVFLMLPWSVLETIFGPLAMDFSTWVISGLMVVVGAVWTIVYNADVLLAVMTRALTRFGAVAPVAKIAMAYPLASRFRTGTTLAMFTLVVFTLVTGTSSSGSFIRAFEDLDVYGGGFDVRAGTSGVTPIDDMREALARTPGARPGDFSVVASQSFLPVEARQQGTRRELEPYPLRGLDATYLTHTTLGLGSIARGYSSSAEVWRAVEEHPGLAVVDSFVVPRRDNFNFVTPTDFKLSGFYYEDGGFEPIPVVTRDPQTGREMHLKVIGVLADTAPLEMVGISTSQQTLGAAFPGRAHPTIHYFAVAPGVDPDAAAARLESSFFGRGMEAESIKAVVADATAASVTFNRLIQGFMGLGLIVGVAALGVISARAVVERRQQIGVLRAIGFRRRMVQATFLLESSFIALTAIAVGTGLGLLLAYNIVSDQRQQPSWDGLTLVVPWLNLGIIFLVVYLVALAATLAPALRASRIRPAEALRYE